MRILQTAYTTIQLEMSLSRRISSATSFAPLCYIVVIHNHCTEGYVAYWLKCSISDPGTKYWICSCSICQVTWDYRPRAVISACCKMTENLDPSIWTNLCWQNHVIFARYLAQPPKKVEMWHNAVFFLCEAFWANSLGQKLPVDLVHSLLGCCQPPATRLFPLV